MSLCVATPALAQEFKVGSFTKQVGTTVTFQSTAEVKATAASTVQLTNFDPGSSANRVLVVGLTLDGWGTPATSLTVTYGGAALTLVAGTSVTGGTLHGEMWYLTNPPSTPANIVASWLGGARNATMGAVAFNNADQTTPVRNGTSITNTTAAVSLPITSAVNDMTFDSVANQCLTAPYLSAPTRTQRWLDQSATGQKAGGSTAAGAATVTHAWTNQAACRWISSAVDIKVAPVPTAQPIAHGLGITPSAIMLWTSGSTATGVSQNSEWSAFGMSDGTTSYSVARSSQTAVTTPNTSRRSAAKAITIVQYGQALQAEADLTWNATNFTLTWSTNNASAYVIHYLVIGGVSAKLVTWTPSAGLGVKGVSTVGFRPDVVFHMEDSDSAALPSSVAGGAFSLGVMDSNSQQWVAALNSLDSGVVANSDTARLQRTDSCIVEINSTGTEVTRATFSSMDALGFSVDYKSNGAQNKMYSLALDGLNIKAGTFKKTTGPLTPTFVQQAAIRVGAVSTVAQPFLAASTTGNLIVVTVTHNGPAVISSIVDSNGNAYTLAVGPTTVGAAINHVSTYYARNITGGAVITITVTLSAAATSTIEFFQAEYSGVATVNPLDQVSAASGVAGGSPVNSGSKQTTQANELIYGFVGTTLGGVTTGASFAGGIRSALDGQSFADKTVAVMGSYNVDGSFAPPKDWAAQMATFRGGQQVAGLGFQPSVVLLASVMDITRAAPNAEARFGIGATDGENENATAIQDADALATTRSRNFAKTDKLFVKVNNNTSTIDAEADLGSIDTDGFSLDWTTNDAVATEMLYVALAPFTPTEVRLTSFTASKYASGVLLEWRTGYEIDNLGFNLYREINGVRTRVNTSLIAGSGLQAGRNAGQNYARWDVDAGAADPGVAYWLEDVEFNGLSTWHGPYTPLVSGMTEPVVADSPELSDSGSANSRRIFFNYNEDPAHPGPRVVPAQVAPEVTSQWALASRATVKMGIRKPGWYRVTQPELVAAGLPGTVDPTTLQLFVDGIEQGIRVNGATATSFDAIEFYASGIDTPYTDTRIYWLQAGIQPGLRVAAGAVGAAPSSTATGFLTTVKRKDRTQYAGGIRNGDTENWFGPTVSAALPTALTLTPSHIDASAVGSAQLSVALQGLTSTSDGSLNHVVGVRVNGTEVGVMTFAGEARVEQTFPVAVVAGDNTVTLEARGGDETRDTSVVDVIKLNYPHTYTADADRLRFTVDSPVSITVGGFASRSIRVVDITDRTAPVELAALVGTAVNGVSPVTVYVPGHGQRTLLAFSDETIGSPAFVAANHPSALNASGNAHDYVVVSHADFIAQVEPLAAHRQAQGREAIVVDIEDVYDEFSFGEKTPQALKDFLQWAQISWNIAPRFVVLAGDATTDPRDYEGLGNSDFVPTKQVAMTLAATETASDDWFVDFDNDGLAEIPIGRLSARTADQAAAVVQKIIDYDGSSPGSWTKSVLLVADQNDVNSNFEQLSETLSRTVTGDYAVQRVFRGADNDAARSALTDRVNEGQLIVNYTGHGNIHFWGGGDVPLLQNAFEGQPVDDVRASWRNLARLPLVVAMNCLNGQFDGIWDEESLAEALQRAPEGGAVAVWTSSSLTPASTQAVMNQELLRLIFSGTYATLGDAVAAAKRSVASLDLRRSLIFFGDPAMRLSGVPLVPVPGSPPTITTQPVSRPIVSNQTAVVSVAATGTAPLTYQWYSRTSSTTMSEILGATSSSYTSPPQMSTVSYMVRVSNTSGFTYSSVAVVSTPPIITTPGQLPAAAVGVPYALTLAAANSTGPYTWTATMLPSGLRLDSTSGQIFDAPNAGGTFTFEVRVTGADRVWTQRTFTLTVMATSLGFAGDGRPALVLQNGSGILQAWVLNGLTATGLNFTPAAILDPNWKIVGSADFNNDGYPDLLLQHAVTGGLYLWYMSGASLLYPTSLSPSGPTDPNWKVAGLADFNADGRPDILFQHNVSGVLVVWYMNGPDLISSSMFSPVGPNDPAWKVVAATDFNGDGKPDLLLQNKVTSVLVLWSMNGVQLSVASLFSPTGPLDANWKVVGVTDLNGDGTPDLVFQHRVTAQLAAWYLSGTTVAGGGSFSPAGPSDPSWKVVTVR